MNYAYSARTKAEGFTLIEILVAVLVLSIGVLGLIAMESLALKTNQSAYHRSQATLLVYDLADRIRANKDAVSTYETFSPSSTLSCVASSPCNSSSDFAKRDLFLWEQKVEEVFPGGNAVSWSVSSVSDDVTIALRWDDDRDGTVTANDPLFSTTFRP